MTKQEYVVLATIRPPTGCKRDREGGGGGEVAAEDHQKSIAGQWAVQLPDITRKFELETIKTVSFGAIFEWCCVPSRPDRGVVADVRERPEVRQFATSLQGIRATIMTRARSNNILCRHRGCADSIISLLAVSKRTLASDSISLASLVAFRISATIVLLPLIASHPAFPQSQFFVPAP